MERTSHAFEPVFGMKQEATTMPSLSPRPCMLQPPVSVTKKLQQRMRQNWDSSTGMMYAGIRKESYAITHGKAEIVLTRFRSPTKPLVRKMSMRPACLSAGRPNRPIKRPWDTSFRTFKGRDATSCSFLRSIHTRQRSFLQWQDSSNHASLPIMTDRQD